MEFLLKLGKTFMKIPVLFTHFPGATLMLCAIVAIASTAAAATLTHELEASARAELKAELAIAEKTYAERRAAAAETRAETIEGAHREQTAIDHENAKFMTEALQAFLQSKDIGPVLEKLSNQVKELHNDPKFDCRSEPLPAPYLDGLSIAVR